MRGDEGRERELTISDRSIFLPLRRYPGRKKRRSLNALMRRGDKIFLAAAGDYNYSSTEGECISYNSRVKKPGAALPDNNTLPNSPQGKFGLESLVVTGHY